MIHFKTENWVWDANLGAEGTAFLGTDFNTNADVEWFETHFPRVLHHLFDAVEIILVPSHQYPAGAILDNKGCPMIVLNMAWLKDEAALRDWDGVEEIVVHERCHVIQLLEGRLVMDHPKEQVIWEGEVYPFSLVGFGPGQRYADLPWEQEAYWEQAKYLYLKRLYASPEVAFDVLMAKLNDMAA